MRILKNIFFHRWSKKLGIMDKALMNAIDEISSGLYEANLGGCLYKKRMAINGRGKRCGVRTIVAFKKDDKAFFIYGFAKNQKANIDDEEEILCKKLAAVLLSYNDFAIDIAIKNMELIEVL